MNAIIATRLWLGGAPLADLQQLIGDQVALEDAIRGEILRAALDDGRPMAHSAVKTEPTEIGRVKPVKNGQPKGAARPARSPAPAPHPTPKPMGPTLDLTGYPAQLQDPRSSPKRAIWDALEKGPREMRSLADELSERIDGDDLIHSLSGVLWSMTASGLLAKDDSVRPSKWRRALASMGIQLHGVIGSRLQREVEARWAGHSDD